MKKNINKIWKLVSSYLKSRILVLIITLLYTFFVLLLLLHRFWQFEAYFYDHGYLDISLWRVAHLQAPITEHLNLGVINIFADHFYLSFYLLAPFYWLTDKYETTVILTAILPSLSIPFAYEIAAKLVKRKYWVYALLFAYMFFIGLQNALIFFLHPETIMILPLMIFFWSIITDRKKLFYVLLFIILGFKETVSALTFATGLFLIFYKKTWRKHGLIVMLISVVYFFVVTKLIQPSFSPIGKYYYEPDWLLVLKESAHRFFVPFLKTKTLFFTFASFAFLPLIYLPFLPIILQDFFLRFVLAPQEPHRWDLGLAYSANLSVTLFVAACFAINFLQRKKLFQKISIFWASCLVTIVIILHAVVFRGPFGLLYNFDFYKHTKNLDFLREFISKIPREGKIMTQNNLAVFFTHNDLVLIKSCAKVNQVQPDVIAFDIREGQSNNNFWPSTEKELKNILASMRESNSYDAIYDDQSKYIFKKVQNSLVDLKCDKDESV